MTWLPCVPADPHTVTWCVKLWCCCPQADDRSSPDMVQVAPAAGSIDISSSLRVMVSAQKNEDAWWPAGTRKVVPLKLRHVP